MVPGCFGNTVKYLLESMFKIIHIVDYGLSLDCVLQTHVLLAIPKWEALKVLEDGFCMGEVGDYWWALLLTLPHHVYSLCHMCPLWWTEITCCEGLKPSQVLV